MKHISNTFWIDLLFSINLGNWRGEISDSEALSWRGARFQLVHMWEELGEQSHAAYRLKRTSDPAGDVEGRINWETW